MVLCVANSEGYVELYDAALQNVSAVLINDLRDMERGIRLRTCFKYVLQPFLFQKLAKTRTYQRHSTTKCRSARMLSGRIKLPVYCG